MGKLVIAFVVLGPIMVWIGLHMMDKQPYSGWELFVFAGFVLIPLALALFIGIPLLAYWL